MNKVKKLLDEIGMESILANLIASYESELKENKNSSEWLPDTENKFLLDLKLALYSYKNRSIYDELYDKIDSLETEIFDLKHK